MALSVRRTARGAQVRLVLLELAEIGGQLDRKATAWAKAHDETPARYKVLTAAGCGDFTVPQIARRMGMTRQGVQRVANLLVDEGHAHFVQNPDHVSSMLLKLTVSGTALDDAISSDIAQDNNEMGCELSLAEWTSLAESLERLRGLL